MILSRIKSKPGSLVQRFGDWRKGEPQVIIDNQTWLDRGKPDLVIVEFSDTPRYSEILGPPYSPIAG